MAGLSMNKKIVHVITGLNDGGAEGVLARLCLKSNCYTHVVISLMNCGKYGPILEAGGITVHCLNMSRTNLNPVLFLKLLILIRSEKPWAVQTWMYHADLLGGLAAKLVGIKRIFWGVRHSTMEKGKSKFSTILMARVCSLFSNLIPNKIICCAHSALKVHAMIGYKQSKMIVICNGFDFSHFKPDLNLRNKIRRELGYGDEKFLIGCVGRFDPQKGHSDLLEALAELFRLQIEFDCLLIGNGLTSDNTELANIIKSMGIENKVKLLGSRTDIPAIMNAIDLHVLASRYGEAFPNVVAEAMSCGTPCVVTDVGDAIEIVGDRKVTCQPYDPSSLASVIKILRREWSEDTNQWTIRKFDNVKRITQEFSIERMVSEFESCWSN
jgi:glycosyltransferase involved in cell wall biosynthesis